MQKIARVLINLSLNKYFDYKIPIFMEDKIKTGSHVIVPFGKTRKEGCVIDIIEKSTFQRELKEIERLSESKPIIPKNLIKLGEWISEYYCCSKEHALRTLLPSPIRSGKITSKKSKFLYINDVDKATEYMFKIEKKSPKQSNLIKFLLNNPESPLSLVKKNVQTSDASISTLIKLGILKKELQNVRRDPYEGFEFVSQEIPELTKEQTDAVSKIKEILEKKTAVSTALIFGVTGSGKTELYLRAIDEVIKKGKDSIVLVPEIALTPQTTERFKSRFGEQVSVLHSSLSDGERFDEWMRIYEGKTKIAVGARSALFAPFTNLGLIIVDEEHEHSYKQDESPRYNARDVAVMRSHIEEATTLLGSATPSFESFYNAKQGKYELIKLANRVDDRVMPSVFVIDMRHESSSKGNTIFSKELVDNIYDRLKKREQSILFLNRRGFSTHLSCYACGYTASCRNCSIDYTFHKAKNYLACHMCGSIIEAPVNCPECGASNIKYAGIGTEKIENIAMKLFPKANIARMDSDSMTHKGAYEDVLNRFKVGNIDILIGTQMLAKGLDFPNVTLVGVINADISLHVPDFRSAERTFQLLTQVSGRAGRGVLPGSVFIQTYLPNNDAIKYAIKHDYESFYENEISPRSELNYPPYKHLSAIKISGENETNVVSISEEFYEKLRVFIPKDIRISPPSPAPISKVKNKFRYSIILRGNLSYRMKNEIKNLIFREFKKDDILISVDIDALNLM